MNKYWLNLNPDVFLWYTKNHILLYNCKNGRLHKCVSTHGLIKKCDSLSDLESFYTIELNEEDLDSLDIRNWVSNILDIDAGKLVPQTNETRRPISFYPLLKIQNDIEAIRVNHANGIGGELIFNLNIISIHINGSENGSDMYSLQTYYPSNASKNIAFEDIEKIVSKWWAGKYFRLNLIGDILNYSHLSDLIYFIESKKINVHIYILSSDLINRRESIYLLNSISSINLICDNLSHLSIISILLKEFTAKLFWIFPVTLEKSYSKINEATNRYGIKDPIILPLYNGKNEKFFENDIFVKEDDFKEIKITKRDIFIHQSLNSNFFGRLIVLPNGDVFANLNMPPLGTINDSLYYLIYKEMHNGKAWRMIRDCKPCNSCVYQWLCPPPSNYEIAIGRTNLCHVT